MQKHIFTTVISVIFAEILKINLLINGISNENVIEDDCA
jgi:hypothetical protein